MRKPHTVILVVKCLYQYYLSSVVPYNMKQHSTDIVLNYSNTGIVLNYSIKNICFFFAAVIQHNTCKLHGNYKYNRHVI